jgi:hypothetical protein
MSHTQARRRKTVTLEFTEQIVFASNLVHTVGLTPIIVVRCVASKVFVDRLREAAPIHGHGTGKDVVLNAAAKQFDHGLNIAQGERCVIKNHIKGVAVIRKRCRERSRYAAIGVDPLGAFR